MSNQILTDFEKVTKTLQLSKENIDLRKKSLDQFMQKGFPNKKQEDWKFSDLNQIISTQIKNLKFFDENSSKEKFEEISLDLFPKYITNNNVILLVNGYVKKINLDYEDLNKIKIINSKENKINNTKESLISLNNAFSSNYLQITVKENYKLNRPLILFNISSKKVKFTYINLRLDIFLENNSLMSIVNKIDYKANSNIKYFYNNIDLNQNSVSENFILSYGSNFIKNEIICNLKEQYSSAFVSGIMNLNEKKHHEIKSKINHIAENTKSYQLIKSVLSEKSKGIYQGKIFVDSKAQKTDGYQLSKALLLSKDTEFDAKPELEIYADDVKCSHGSTSGNLDENAIFYLMTRGIKRDDAKKLLINGFLKDVLEKITDTEIKKIINNIIGI